jgi:adenylylsulfate kinase-like enzyme
LVNFTGIDSDYERPEAPDIRLDTVANSPVECVDLTLSYLHSKALHKTAGSESSHGRSRRL